MSINQTFRVSGVLDIDAVSGYRSLAGEINFLGPSKSFYGRTRVIGTGGSYTMMLDTSGCSQGLVVRTNTSQGNDQIGGTNYQFPLQVKDRTTTAILLDVDQKKLGAVTSFFGNPVFTASRESTADGAGILSSAISSFYQREWKTNEEIFIQVGFAPFYAYSGLGYHSLTANPFDTTNTGFLSIWDNGNNVKCITWTPNGNVNIPRTLTVDTISATTYLNLPTTPPPSLLPITLDAPNSFVGINQTVPTQALDVTGTIAASVEVTTPLLNKLRVVSPNATNNVAIGPSAGETTQGVNCVAVGPNAGNTTQGSSSVAIGNSAGANTQSLNAVAIGSLAGANTQGSSGVAIGRSAGATQQLSGGIAVGGFTGQTNQGLFAVAIGYNAANSGQGTAAVAIGQAAGKLDQHANSIVLNATGADLNTNAASQLVVKPIRNAAGPQALAYDPTSGEITYNPAPTPSLLPITLDVPNSRVGINKAVPTTTLDVDGTIAASVAVNTPLLNNLRLTSPAFANVAIGMDAGLTNQANYAVAIGPGAGNANQSDSGIAIGQNAGSSSQGLYSVAMGINCARTTQGGDCVAIGRRAGDTTQGFGAVAVGAFAGGTTQGTSSVAIGSNAGQTTQGNYSVAVGLAAGSDNQKQNTVAIGNDSGKTTQGENAVAVGYGSGRTNQGVGATAVGVGAGYNAQGASSVAVGQNAGNDTQGAYSVAIGGGAGQTNQHANSIVLNGTGAALNTTATSQLVVKPIRLLQGPQNLVYDPISGEITYMSFPATSTTGTGELGANISFPSNTNVTVFTLPLVTGTHIIKFTVSATGFMDSQVRLFATVGGVLIDGSDTVIRLHDPGWMATFDTTFIVPILGSQTVLLQVRMQQATAATILTASTDAPFLKTKYTWVRV
jgi:hypothetical protein